jgi:type VI protein secretion system component VasF
VGELVDRGDGFYVQTLASTGDREAGRITVRIDGVVMQTQPKVRFGWPNWLIALTALLLLVAFWILLVLHRNAP